MKKYSILIAVLSLILGCTHRPETKRQNIPPSDGTFEYSLPRKSRPSSPKGGKNNLPARIKKLEKEIERAYKRGSVSAEKMLNWSKLYGEYTLEYSLSTHTLSDAECEFVEFHLGKIAGFIYNNSVGPVIDEVEQIANGLDEYETRSKRWEGAAERGFKSVVGGDIDF